MITAAASVVRCFCAAAWTANPKAEAPRAEKSTAAATPAEGAGRPPASGRAASSITATSSSWAPPSAVAERLSPSLPTSTTWRAKAAAETISKPIPRPAPPVPGALAGAAWQIRMVPPTASTELATTRLSGALPVMAHSQAGASTTTRLVSVAATPAGAPRASPRVWVT